VNSQEEKCEFTIIVYDYFSIASDIYNQNGRSWKQQM
jgi:hypothetical protein